MTKIICLECGKRKVCCAKKLCKSCYQKGYRKISVNHIKILVANRNWRSKNPEYSNNHRKARLKSDPEFKKRCKEIQEKHLQKYPETKAKYHAFGRGLGFKPLFENIIDEPFEWHHINKIHVVALPRDIHRLYQGKYHTCGLKYVIKQIYREELA